MCEPDARDQPPNLPLEQRAALAEAAKGFGRLVLGIPAMLLLFSGAMSIRFLDRLGVPSYLVGVLLVAWGAGCLLRAGSLTPVFRGVARRLLGVTLLLFYFVPFVHWWGHRPFETFYTVNVLALVLCMTGLLLTVNQAGQALARAVGDAVFTLECRLCGWAVIALMTLPLLAYFLYAAVVSAQFDTNLFLEVTQMLQYDIPSWVHGAFLLPFTLTMMVAWKAKERGLGFALGTWHPPTPEETPQNTVVQREPGALE